LDGNITDEDWRQNQLVVLSRDPGRTLVLFSSDDQLTEFRRKLGQYLAGPPAENRNPSHNALFATIGEEGLMPLDRQDRIGASLAAIGIDEAETYSLDLELWPLGSADERNRRANQIEEFVASQGGSVVDRINNESMVIFRVTVLGSLANNLLDLPLVARLDLPPIPTLPVSEVLDFTLQGVPAVPPPPDAVSICIVDSGITRGHPLLGPAVRDIDMFPASLGSPDDGHGHGTMVAGIAVYGDIAACIQTNRFAPPLVIYSARVLNDQNRFDDNTLIVNQMRAAITRFAAEGCRVFNIFLGDDSRVYGDGRLSPWAAVLDSLARELDVLIVVAAGNRTEIPDDPRGSARLQYPGYLLDDAA